MDFEPIEPTPEADLKKTKKTTMVKNFISYSYKKEQQLYKNKLQALKIPDRNIPLPY